MSDQAILGFLLAFSVVIGVGGFVVMISMLREAQQLTRAVAAMVYQESEKTRAVITDRG